MGGQMNATETLEIRKTRRKTNPLKILRSLLRSKEHPLTQAEFALATDIPVDSVRNIENNRRTLTRTHLRKIEQMIGAEWDSGREIWHLYGNPDMPYTSKVAEAFRSRWMGYHYQDAEETHILCRRLVELMVHVEPEAYNTLFYRLFDAMDDIRKELHITGARPVFEQTEFQINLVRGAETKEFQTVSRKFTLDDSIVKTHDGREDWLNLSWLLQSLRYGKKAKKENSNV
jgi:hypothetical protein